MLTGWPGTVASVWQQAGRAGRAGQGALAVFVARDDPLDTYLVHHPEAMFGRPVEATVLDPANPYVLAPHLCCAAAELPLTEADLPLFGDPTRRCGCCSATWCAAACCARGRPAGSGPRGTGRTPTCAAAAVRRCASSRRAPAGCSAPSTPPPRTARPTPAPSTCTRARRTSWSSSTSTRPSRVVRRDDPDHTTSAREVTDIRVVEELRGRSFDGVRPCTACTVDVTHQVVAFLRKRVATGEVLGEEPLDLPPRQLRTRAVMYTVSEELLEAAGLGWTDVPGAAHAAEHAAIGLLPLFATCDRWDIGGVSTALHEDTGACTVFVYDGHPGGAGFAERGYERAEAWLRATREAIASCECAAGCPSCVQSPKCGNGNEPLDKAGAVRFLDAVLHSGLAE